MREQPPPGKLWTDPTGREHWVCYYCDRELVRADFALLQPREVWRCYLGSKRSGCGRYQMIGSGEDVRRAALSADTSAADEDRILAELRQASDQLLARGERISKTKLALEAG